MGKDNWHDKLADDSLILLMSSNFCSTIISLFTNRLIIVEQKSHNLALTSENQFTIFLNFA